MGKRCVGLIAFQIAVAGVAHAQSNTALAEALFEEATKLVQEQRYADACPKFAESQRLDPQLGTLLNLADCHEHTDKLATAWSEYKAVVDLASRAGDRARVDYASTRVKEIEPNVARVRFEIPSTIARVKLDDAELGPAVWSAALPIDSGNHVVEVADREQHTATQSFSIANGEQSTVHLSVPVAPSIQTERSISPLVWIGGGVTLVGLGIGIGAGVFALDEASKVKSNCTLGPEMNRCPDPFLTHLDQAHTGATVSTVGFILAGVGAATLLVGTILSLQSKRVVVRPMLGPVSGVSGIF